MPGEAQATSTAARLVAQFKEFFVVKVLDPFVGALPRNAKIHLAQHSMLRETTESHNSLGREALARVYLRGAGLEIGGLNSPLAVPPDVKVSYVDVAAHDTLQELCPDLEVKAPDIVTDGETLACVEDESQDFVIANHFLEHCLNPIGAFENFLRVVRPGGILFLAVPDKRFTFDVNRPVTTFEHLLRDYREGDGNGGYEHFREFHEVILGITDEGQIRRHMKDYGHTHYHVWTTVELLELLAGLRKELGFDFEVETLVGNRSRGELIMILRKGEARMTEREQQDQIAYVRDGYQKQYPDFKF